VIVAAARTGTNLLAGLLNDFEGCFVGSELFNDNNVSNDIIPWHDISDADRLAFQTVGFKLLYSQGLSQKDLLEHLVTDETVPIIHLKRRNLLRTHARRSDGEWYYHRTPQDRPADA